MSEGFLMNIIFDGIADKLMSDLDEGLVDVSDEVIYNCLAVCLTNETSGKFVGKLYKTGEESLTAGR